MDAIVFGAVALVLVVLFAAVYAWPRRGAGGGATKRYLSPTFARVYGLISIAILAVATVRLTEDAAVLTGVFTLFGTIAGYLAGARVSAVGAGEEAGEPKQTTGDAGVVSASSLELG